MPAARSSVEMEQANRPAAAAPSQAKDGLAALARINTPAAPALQPAPRADGKVVLTEIAGYKHTGFAFPWWKKWGIITSIFVVQLSMNWNAAIYGNAIPGLKEEFGVDDVMGESFHPSAWFAGMLSAVPLT